MEGLRDLRVWLAMSPATEMPERVEQEMLSPLGEVGPKRVFKVRVSWALKEWVGEGGSDVDIVDTERKLEMNYDIIRQEDQDWGAAKLRLQNH